MMSFFRPKTITQKIFSNIPTLTTERLILRKIIPSDAQDMYEYSCLPEVTKYLTWFEHDSPEYTKSYLAALQTAYRKGEFYDWGIELKENSKFIGTCGFTCFNESTQAAEVGYVLSPSFHHQGFMTEALKAVIAFGFETLALQRIEARHIEGNTPSAEVMKRCGMQFEGRMRNFMSIKGQYRTIHIYSILNKEYFNKSSPREP